MSFNNIPVVAIIPARAGSKGIPDKNITPVCGKPLIQYSIDAALGSKYIDRVVVSSDGQKILETAQNLGAEQLQRPAELATDQASSHLLISHAIQALGLENSYIILLQPTSPLRTSAHIDDAFIEMAHRNAENLISVYQPPETPYKAYKLTDDGYLTGLISKEAPYMRRQDLPPAFFPNGAIYIFSAKNFLKEDKIPSEKVIPFEMTPGDSIDVDTPEDIARIIQIFEDRK
ncbi:cytidylyltransferase domain-containing protein [Emcibacter sp.]|uniref:acylneuraminate cytidylyltransferase family protein n=1 Tax=Emcibacter sp. TaxID=1979954 RepID=UPI003A8DC2BF